MPQWYYAQDEEQHGPVSAAALKEMAQDGKISPDDLIWREGMRRWAPARKVRGLFPDEEETDRQSQPTSNNGRLETSNVAEDDHGDDQAASSADSDRRVSDVVLAEDEDAEDSAGSEPEDDEDDISGDDETAIDVLPLAGPEGSKLHVPVLTAPQGEPESQSDESDEIVVFEPASASPPPPMRKPKPGESDLPRSQDASAGQQTRIDIPATGRKWVAGVGLFLQTFTWVTCLLTILVGGIVYLSALTMSADPSQRLAASGIYATFVLAAYFLARCTERICRAGDQWLGVNNRRKLRRAVRERNSQRFQ